MSKYYKINDLKVRVSDHEPNFSMNKFRGTNDIEFYTKSADNQKLSVIAQIEKYCDKNDIDINLFSEIMKDYSDEEYEYFKPKKIKVTQEFIEEYRKIKGKGSWKKQKKLCEKYGYDIYDISQRKYLIENNIKQNNNNLKGINMTTQNYNELISQVGVQNLTPVQLEFHNSINEYIKDGIYDELMKEPDIADKVNHYIASLQTTKKTETKEPAKPQAPKKEAKPKAEKKAKAPKKVKAPKPEKPTAKMVANIPPEYFHIKKYIKLATNKISKADLLAQLKTLQRAITMRTIGKDSKFADEIRKIQKHLVQAYNLMVESGTKELLQLEMSNEFITKLKKIVGEEEVCKYVAIIKRYLKFLSGKKHTIDEAKKIINVINKFNNNYGKYESEIKSVKQNLQNFIDGKDIKLSEAELRGLAGICNFNVNGFAGLGGIGTFLTIAGAIVLGNRANKYLDKNFPINKKTNVINSEDIIDKKFDTYEFTGKYLELIGKPEKNFKMLVFGEPKGGKSTEMINFAKYLATNFGKVIFVAKEEGIGETLQEKLIRLNATHSNLTIADSLPENLNDYKFVFIDSINRSKLSYDDLVALMNKHNDKALIFISQVTKEGIYRGTTELEHDVDIIMKIDREGNISSWGRYSQGGKGKVDFCNEKNFNAEIEKTFVR